MTEKVPIIVVLGIDVDGRPHASRFDQRDARVVRRAAELRVPVEGDHGFRSKLITQSGGT